MRHATNLTKSKERHATVALGAGTWVHRDAGTGSALRTLAGGLNSLKEVLMATFPLKKMFKMFQHKSNV